MLLVCANCNKIKDSWGRWSDPVFKASLPLGSDQSHTYCPDCLTELFPNYAAAILNRQRLVR
ncbi:hypothetical protein DGWBC_0229 [Dehalogenimonas sp. WBC-2]|nr:hypothetical protein DGWBC_0229 [Dehalogenimonas sp. WBC-2]